MSDVKFGLVQSFVGTSDGTYTNTDSNFGGATPFGAFIGRSWGTAINTPRDGKAITFGAAESNTSTELFCLTQTGEHNQTSTDTGRQIRQTSCSYLLVPGGARDGDTVFSVFTNNNVTLDIDNTYTSDNGEYVLLIGGTDLNLQIGAVTITNTEDVETLITTGFDMTNSALMLFGQDSGFTAGTSDFDDARMLAGMGSYDGTTFRQSSFAHFESNAEPDGMPNGYLHDSRILNAADAAFEWSLEWTTANSTQFGLTPRDATMGSGAIGYIAFGLPSDWNANVSVQDMPTSVSNPTTFTPAGASGWTPKILIQLLTLMESVDTHDATKNAGGYGLRVTIGTASDDEYCVSANMEDASPTTNVESGIHDSGFLNEDDGTTGYEMDLNSFISGGWRDDFVNVMGTAKKTICLVMGEDDAVVAPSQNIIISQAIQRAANF